jgi:hypothetical protein
LGSHKVSPFGNWINGGSVNKCKAEVRGEHRRLQAQLGDRVVKGSRMTQCLLV